ncbi:AAA family ATPase [Cellulosimicrobium sp. I38E]|uniref:ATP-binding protein n=1 Tax=Cellulosimicrobium sp. I38E TaxID=1393139 RepID=UPI0009ED7618|nr:LuxR family transcriptional regulator [Cellulosimicrobium sp. I38E]
MTPGLVGRRTELALVDALYEGIDDGGAALLVEGAPGVGKTALVDELERRARARGMGVLRTAGTLAESTVPYAGLHLLLHPLRDRFAELPRPQREALDVAFGAREGSPPTLFLVGLATLTLLSDAAKDRPLLVVAEDLHWLDPISRSALQMAARRLASDPVLVVMTTRGGDHALASDGVRHLHLGPLPFIDANAVLDARPDAPRGATRRALLELADGNPLALVELTASDVGLTEAGLVPLPDRLELAFAGRFADLPEPARLAVLAVALDTDAAADDATRVAARALGRAVGPGWLDAALDAGLLRRDEGSVPFRHPLVRSAVTSASTTAERTAVLRALLDVRGESPERTVWWRAELAGGPDAALADELDVLADRSLAAGDATQAVRALRRSATLTADPGVRAVRLVRAAEAAAGSGATDVAVALLDRVETDTADPAVRARVAWLRELLPVAASALARGDLGPALRAIDDLGRAGETDRALDALLRLASIAWDHSTEAESGRPLVDAARLLDLDADDPRALFLAAVTEPVARGDEIVARIRALPDVDDADAQRDWQLGYALNKCGEIEPSAAYLQRAVDGLRRSGDVALLPHALLGLSWIDYLRGRFAEARAQVEDCAAIAVDVDDPGLLAAARAVLAWFDALDGSPPDLDAIAGGSALGAQRLAARELRATLTLADGMAALVSGRPRDAERAFLRVADPDDAAHTLVWRVVSLPDLVDAAVLSGHRREASSHVEEVARLAPTWHAPVLDAALRFARLALVEDAGLETAARALDRDPLAMPFFQARARLLVGRRLRRTHRPDEARRHLHLALEAFTAFPAPRWAERCLDELRATGERLPDAAPSGRHVLTPQELRVCVLAVEGLRNREIAERLFLSPRTVGAHLYAAFTKLGITSRDQLAGALRRE